MQISVCSSTNTLSATSFVIDVYFSGEIGGRSCRRRFAVSPFGQQGVTWEWYPKLTRFSEFNICFTRIEISIASQNRNRLNVYLRNQQLRLIDSYTARHKQLIFLGYITHQIISSAIDSKVNKKSWPGMCHVASGLYNRCSAY